MYANGKIGTIGDFKHYTIAMVYFKIPKYIVNKYLAADLLTERKLPANMLLKSYFSVF